MSATPGSRRFLLLLFPLAMQIACSRPPADPPPPADSSVGATESNATRAPSGEPSGASAVDMVRGARLERLPAVTRSSVEKTLAAYETIRARLAEDKTEGIGQAAAQIARAASSAKEGAPGPVREPLEKLASTAAALEKIAGGDLAKVRAGFGEVSRALMGLLTAEPSLARGLYVFECPMTDTYRKWIQNQSEISNPYMGTGMLSCGTQATWQP
jgi:hypothetical protein